MDRKPPVAQPKAKTTLAVDDEAETGGESLPKSEYLQFIWQSVNDVNKCLGEIRECYGRLDTKVDNLSSKVDGMKADLKKLDTIITRGRALMVAGAAILATIFAIYKVIEPYISMTVHAPK